MAISLRIQVMCRGARWDCNCFITYNKVGNLPPIYNGEFGHGINHRFFRDFQAPTWIFSPIAYPGYLPKISGKFPIFLSGIHPTQPKGNNHFLLVDPDNTPPRLPDCPETIGLEVKVTAWLVTFLVSKRCWLGKEKLSIGEIHLSIPVGRIANFVYVIFPLLLEINSSFGEFSCFIFSFVEIQVQICLHFFSSQVFRLAFFLHVGPLGALFG